MKVRVYELAKEAGMDSKALATKLIELGYDVKAYNSSIDEETADEIREKLKSTQTEVQEKRIQTKGRTTIIRRRTKSVPTLEVPPSDPEEEAALVEEALEAEEEKALAAQEEVSAEIAKDDTTDEDLPERKSEEAVSVEENIDEGLDEQGEEPDRLTAESEKNEDEELKTVEASKAVIEQEEDIATETGGDVDHEVQVDVEVEDSAEVEPEEDKKEVSEDSDDEVSEIETREEEKPAKSRKGLARVIKKAAIQLPVEEKKPERPAPKKPAKSKPKRSVVQSSEPDVGIVDFPVDDGVGSGKGKKGKRFVKFHHHSEPGVKPRKASAKRKGYAVVDMEDVAMAGGRLSSALKVGRGGRGGGKKNRHDNPDAGETKAIKKRIKIYDSISIGDLAHRMGVKINEVIVKLMGLGVMATVNQALDFDTAALVSTDFGYEVEQGETEEISITNLDEQESGGEMISRPPVVTVMGHVDHGKTSILDAIRNTDVAAGEAGGITQHIGAHYVRSSQGDVVFLDTPGHAAFTEMRSRGAKVTDVVVLVVAADDGVMDQTKEAINHAKAAEVPIVVAVNKIDKEDADPMRVKRELADYNLVPEEWGGDTIFCEVSAKQNIGIGELLEQILLQAEILELKADPHRKAKGRVVEAHLHKGRGAVATILVQEGTLRVGSSFVVGEFYGKVRSLFNDKGEKIKEAGPAMPVEVQGLSGVPMSGDEFIEVPDEKMAKYVSSQRQIKNREIQLGQTTKISLDNLFEKLQEGEVKELCVLLRADVQGTLEAFGKALDNLATDAVRVRVLHEGTGTITDSDVLLAAASNAIIIGFNVRPSIKVQGFAKSENVDVRFYDVIYHALDDIRNAMAGMLDPTFEERVIGTLEIRDTFSVPKVGTIAGCYVSDGKIVRNAKVRLLREGVVIYTGNISSLKRFKDDAKEVASGYECGVGIENFNDIKTGDTLEAFVLDEVAAEL